MILVLDPQATQALVDDVVSRVEARGWRCEISRGEEQLVIGVSGDGDPSEIEALFAEHAHVDVVPILSRQEYQKLRLRRRLMTGVAGGLGLLTALGAGFPVIGFLLPPKGMRGDREFVKAATASEMERRKAKSIEAFGKSMLLIRLEGGRYFAVSAICTHMSVCKLEWHAERDLLVCPCHGGAFDVYGNVVHGPPSIPLATHKVEQIDADLFIRREG